MSYIVSQAAKRAMKEASGGLATAQRYLARCEPAHFWNPKILKEIAPGITTVMMLYYSENPNWQGHWETIKAAALVLGINVSAAPVTNAAEFPDRIQSFAQKPAAGMVIVPSG
jgi:ABC-type sugar transport system substrate-binding protein